MTHENTEVTWAEKLAQREAERKLEISNVRHGHQTKKASKKWAVEHYTICDGWANTWSVEDTDGNTKQHVFDSREDAQSELDEFFEDIESEIATGARSADEGYERAEFRIRSCKMI